MRCPFCDEDDGKVIDSRATNKERSIRRRRQCLACGKRFTTREHVESSVRVRVVKKDRSRVPYDRRKLLAGLEKACYKRPVSAEVLEQLVEQVEEELFSRPEREIDAMLIGRVVANHLKTLDRVAYVRFASVYKQFRDLDDFLDEVRNVLEADSADAPNQGKLF